MLSSIHPLGERTRNASWARTVSAYIVGSMVGGVALGTLATVVGFGVRMVLDERAAVAAIAAAALVAAWIDVRAAGRALPSWHRQVSEDWLATYRDWIYGFGFGAQLGFGLATYVTTAAVYLMVLVAALVGGVGGIVIGGAFGLARGVLILAGRRIESPSDLRNFHRRLNAAAAPIRTSTAAALAIAGIAATVSLATL